MASELESPWLSGRIVLVVALITGAYCKSEWTVCFEFDTRFEAQWYLFDISACNNAPYNKKITNRIYRIDLSRGF
jgi:hypothetical protein